MNKKNIFLLILVIVLMVGVLIFYYLPRREGSFSELTRLKTEKPELVSYIEEIEASSVKLNKDDITTYAVLGLAWKSLADQTQNKEYYAKALDVYEEAIEITQRKNTLFILNAGNMSQYLEDYQMAKSYYEEAITIDAGDEDSYRKLIELHMYKLKSDKEEIIPIFDQAIKTLINPASFIQWKESYLAGLNNE